MFEWSPSSAQLSKLCSEMYYVPSILPVMSVTKIDLSSNIPQSKQKHALKLKHQENHCENSLTFFMFSSKHIASA